MERLTLPNSLTTLSLFLRKRCQEINSMGHARAMEKDIFADAIEKIQSLTGSQQRFLQEMLASREKVTAVSRKKLLRKSYT